MLDELYRPFKSLNLTSSRHQQTKITIIGRPINTMSSTQEIYVSKDEIQMAVRLQRFASGIIKNWTKAFVYLSLIIVALSLVVSLQKPTFVDLSIFIYLYGHLIFGKLTSDRLRGLLIAFGVTILIDLGWLTMFWRNWCAIYPPDLPDCALKNHLLWVVLGLIPIRLCFILVSWRNTVFFDDFKSEFDRMLIAKPKTLV